MSKKYSKDTAIATLPDATETEASLNGKPTEVVKVSKLSQLASEVGLDVGPQHIKLEEQDCKQLTEVLGQLANIRDAIAQHQLEVLARQQAMQQLAAQHQQVWTQRNQIWNQINRIYGLEKYKNAYRFVAAEKRLVREDGQEK